jgi:enamine deaminase RidA (YjgF/YER057c/UK114 family)
MIEDKLKSFGISLPKLPAPAGTYVPVLRTGNLIFISGQIPFECGTSDLPRTFLGKVPIEVSIETGQQAARQCTINAIAQLKFFVGNLDLITKFIKVTGYVNCESTFTEHSKVINGASNLLVDLFAEKGNHTRVAIGVNSLPLGSVVEIDFLCEMEQMI